jgi:dTDP-4-amino-4,6-dideoxygalactose transaminase
MRRVEVSAPDIDETDIDHVVTVLRSGQLSIGPYLTKFEDRMANYVGTRHAIGVSNGTAGLHLCICAAGLRRGDEVITTPFSFVASANCILYEHGTPIFADIDEDTMNIDPSAAAAAVTSRSRAILPVHIFGQPSPLDELEAICRKSDLLLIEDACEALGAEYQGKKVGSLGKAAVFSFYPSKPITTGEGGVITTDDDLWAKKLRSLRNQGRDEMGSSLTHQRLGFNYRLDEMSAALGFSQLSRIDDVLMRREKVAEIYAALLGNVPGVRVLAPSGNTWRRSWFVFLVRLDESIAQDRMVEELKSRGIGTRTYFTPIHLQHYFKERFDYRGGEFPVAERVARTTLALPFHSRMAEADIEYVVSCLDAAVDASSQKPGRYEKIKSGAA